MKTNLLTLVVTLTLGVILAGSLLMPVVTDAENFLSDKEYLTNYTDSPYIEETDDYTYIHTSEGITINGESATVGSYTQIIITDGGVIYKIGDSKYSMYLPSQGISKLFTVSETNSFTATISNNEVTVEHGSNTYTQEIGIGYAYTGNGEYTEHTQTTFNVNKGQTGVLTVGDWYYSTYNGIAIVNDWTTGSATFNYNIFTTTATPGEDHSCAVTWTVTDNKDGSYTISNIVFEDDIPQDGSNTHRHLIPNEYFVYEATGSSSLISAIPIIVIIGLVLAGVGAIFIRNRD